jgi:hypothetical protein
VGKEERYSGIVGLLRDGVGINWLPSRGDMNQVEIVVKEEFIKVE